MEQIPQGPVRVHTSYTPKDDLDDIVFDRMDTADLLYVDLDRILKEHGAESLASMYFSAEGPVADGVLFFREVGLTDHTH